MTYQIQDLVMLNAFVIIVMHSGTGGASMQGNLSLSHECKLLHLHVANRNSTPNCSCFQTVVSCIICTLHCLEREIVRVRVQERYD